MKIPIPSGWLLPCVAAAALFTAAIFPAQAQNAAALYPAGSTVEAQWAGDNKWYKAEVLEFKDGIYKVCYEVDGAMGYFGPERIRSLAGAAPPARQPKAPMPDRQLFDLLDTSKNGYLSGTEIPPDVASYDANGDGRLLFEEFAAGRAKALGGSPAPAGDNTTPAAPADQPVAVEKLPALPPRKATPGLITGRAVFADGRPVPKFKASASGWANEIHLGQGGTVPTLGEVDGLNGRFELQPTSAFDRTKLLKDSLVTIVRADALITRNGSEFSIPMHPIDGLNDGTGEPNFKGRSSTGVVRDFVLKTHGPRRGYEKNTPPRESISDELSDPSFGAFYGGKINIDFDARVGNAPELARLRKSNLKITLTPTGPLLDGAAARIVVRTLTLQNESPVGFNLYFRDIPLADYTASLSLIKPDGSAFPLRLRVPGGEWQASALVCFTPAGSQRVETARIMSIR